MRDNQKKMEIGPHHRATEPFGSTEQVMVVIPIDADHGEAQDV
jgi:hypothetical protein